MLLMQLAEFQEETCDISFFVICDTDKALSYSDKNIWRQRSVPTIVQCLLDSTTER